MNSTPTTAPGTHFEYSDINYMVLGALVEKLSGQALDVYARQHIFDPLKMTFTRYLPMDKGCGPDHWPKSVPRVQANFVCTDDQWFRENWIPHIAPTQHDNEGTAETNPDFDHLLRGTVHDPTTRRMGGVAGQAGVFSTAADMALFAQALLDKLLYDKGPFPLKQSTLKLMTSPEQPGDRLGDLNPREFYCLSVSQRSMQNSRILPARGYSASR